jgi:hypothetical protein
MKDHAAPLEASGDLPPHGPSTGPSRSGWLWTLVGADAHAGILVALAGVPVLGGIWALLSPGRVLSREMTWDFLFLFSGAWHLHYGHVAHVDFHTVLGVLNFLPLLAGFQIFGISPLAFLAGVIMVVLAVFTLASWAAWRRLPLIPACFFVVFVSLLILTPANVGDRPNVFSFAMSYNRYGWSALCILALILYVPPRNGRGGDWVDIGAVGFLLVAMFYLKVTYFVAGLGLLGLAVLVCPHVRCRWQVWIAIGVALVANALAPYNHPYLADIWDAAQAGGIRTSLNYQLLTFLPGAAEYAPYAAALAVAWLMWRRGQAPLQLPVAVAFIIVIGFFVLTQNSQPGGVPLCIVIAFLMYDQLRHRLPREPAGNLTLLMLAFMVFPLASIVISSTSLAAYNIRARNPEGLSIVDRTQLKGLAVPAEEGDLLAAFSSSRVDPRLLGQVRMVGARYELSAFEYVETILEAAALLQDGRDGRNPRGGVALLDQVNPLPFMLGREPPRGDNLWSGPFVPLQPAAKLFAEVDYVLVPKFSALAAWTSKAMTEYGPFLAEHYPFRKETPSWILFSRMDDAPSNQR